MSPRRASSPEYRLYLSDRRARGLRAILVEFGVAGERVRARGYGGAVPIASNDTPEGARRTAARVDRINRPGCPGPRAPAPVG